MAKVPLPERGQPLDVPYLYKLVDTINQLSTEVSSATFNYATIDTRTAGKQSAKTSETRIVGGYVPVVATLSTVSASTEKTFFLEFTDFKFAPIVTATLENTGGTPAGKNVNVILTSVTTSRVDGFVRFGESGNLAIAVNLIIVGIPN